MEKSEGRVIYPFTAIVGQEKAKLALLCVAVNPTIGGVLLSGDKGTGKSTLVRALARVLPDVRVVDGCPFNCNPDRREEMCPACAERASRGEPLPVRTRKMRVVDLPLSITVDRLVGTLDIERALREGIRALQPGLLAEANRNILYVDEVNLLDDYVADVLLDAAAMGWNVVEREGVSVQHPARFIFVGSMNPEEGDLRPQILDRFGLFVNVEASDDPRERVEIMKRVEEFHADPAGFRERYAPLEEETRQRVLRARELLPTVEISDDLLELIARTVVEMGIKTHRAEITTVKTAKTIAALDGRRRVRLEDVERALELTLPHRLRSHPFEKKPPPPPPRPPRDDRASRHEGETAGKRGGGGSKRGSGNDEAVFRGERVSHLPEGPGERRGAERARRGSRAEVASVIGGHQGVPVSHVPAPSGKMDDVDLAGTIRAAALRGRVFLPIRREDVRIRVRRARLPRLSVIVLDSSGSMAARRRIALAKGLAEKIVESSYVRRDFLSLVAFRGAGVEVVVPPTRRYVSVLEALETLPTGGRTPLPSALYSLLTLSRSFRRKWKECAVRAYLITDGKANVPMGGERVGESVARMARALAREGVHVEIYDTRPAGVIDPAPSYIETLSEALNAPVHRV